MWLSAAEVDEFRPTFGALLRNELPPTLETDVFAVKMAASVLHHHTVTERLLLTLCRRVLEIEARWPPGDSPVELELWALRFWREQQRQAGQQAAELDASLRARYRAHGLHGMHRSGPAVPAQPCDPEQCSICADARAGAVAAPCRHTALVCAGCRARLERCPYCAVAWATPASSPNPASPSATCHPACQN